LPYNTHVFKGGVGGSGPVNSFPSISNARSDLGNAGNVPDNLLPVAYNPNRFEGKSGKIPSNKLFDTPLKSFFF